SNARIQEVLRYALARSESFQDLIATMDLFDRVVYVEEGQCRHGEHRACLQLMPGGKNVLVQIDPRQPMRAVVAQLAHELYHAVEVAREPDVRRCWSRSSQGASSQGGATCPPRRKRRLENGNIRRVGRDRPKAGPSVWFCSWALRSPLVA